MKNLLVIAPVLTLFGSAHAQILDAPPSCSTVAAKDTDVLADPLELFVVNGETPAVAKTVGRCAIDYPMKLYACGHARFFLWWQKDGANYFVEKSKFFQAPPAPPTGGSGGAKPLASPGSGDTSGRNGMQPCK